MLATAVPCLAVATSFVDVTGRLTLEEAVAKGVQARVESSWQLEYSLNFAEFAFCRPEQVSAQSFNSKGEVQLNAPLKEVDGWYKFSVGLEDAGNIRISLICESGDRNIYLISL